MIPKTIHYCWFGGQPLPEMARHCIASWERYCPDFRIVRWDETSFDLHYNDYVWEAYQAKKWAFITDVVRLYVLVNEGGIYMDTDVEVLKSLDDLLQYQALSGFESANSIPTGLMACEKGFPLFKKLLQDYDDKHFLLPDGAYDLTTNVVRITNICLDYGFVPNNKKQTVEGFTLFPNDYFCPKDHVTRVTHVTENTYTIHHFDGSWKTDEERYAAALKQHYTWIPLRFIKGIASLKYDGIRGLGRRVWRWIKHKSAKGI